MVEEMSEQAVALLRRILPPDGLRIGCTMIGDRIGQQVVCETTEQLVEFLLNADVRGQDAYYACATYRERTGVYNERKKKWQLRCQANVLWVSSFWADIDTREGKPDAPYGDRQEAWNAALKFCKASRMPLPVVVNSGYGLHLYWPLRAPVAEAVWRIYAKQLAQLFEQHGLKVDKSRTQDSASILRAPGTHNRKYGRCVPVQCGELVGPYQIDDLPLGSIVEALPGALGSTEASPQLRLRRRLIDNVDPPPRWSEREEADLRSALAHIPAVDRQIWLLVGMALHWTGWPRAFQIWDEWSRTAPHKYNEVDQRKTWESFGRSSEVRATKIATIYHLAKQGGLVGEATTPITQQAAPAGSSETAVKSTTDRILMTTAADLRLMTFEPVRYVLPKFVPEGVTLLVGRPKIGKSWWVLDFCLACAGDRPVFGNMKAVHGDVLYLALEDKMRRLQRRIDKLMQTFNAEWPKRLGLVASGGWRRSDQGGLEDIDAWCKSVPKPVLVVIDTLERIRKPANGKTSLYSADYEAITGLQNIAIKHGIAIVVLHHDRKSESEDAFDTVSGTLGLTGAADTILMLKRRSTNIVLHARGRDIEESETAMQFDKATCRWTMIGPAAEVVQSDQRGRVIGVLKSAGQPLSVTDIMNDAELPSRSATDTLLFRMVNNGMIERVGKGRYKIPVAVNDTQETGKFGKKERSNAKSNDEIAGKIERKKRANG
jgi:AAA domain/Primase C terminal 2 (PriCT-2)